MSLYFNPEIPIQVTYKTRINNKEQNIYLSFKSMILGLEVMILWYLKIFLTKETILQLGTVGGREA